MKKSYKNKAAELSNRVFYFIILSCRTNLHVANSKRINNNLFYNNYYSLSNELFIQIKGFAHLVRTVERFEIVLKMYFLK